MFIVKQKYCKYCDLQNDNNSYVYRSKIEEEMLQFMHQSSREKVTHSSDLVLASDDLQQNRGTADGNTYDKGQNCSYLQETASLIGIWTEEDLGNQNEQWTETNPSCWLSKTQATHTEVLVEVLVHDKPVSVESDKQERLCGRDSSCWDTASKSAL